MRLLDLICNVVHDLSFTYFGYVHLGTWTFVCTYLRKCAQVIAQFVCKSDLM